MTSRVCVLINGQRWTDYPQYDCYLADVASLRVAMVPAGQLLGVYSDGATDFQLAHLVAALLHTRHVANADGPGSYPQEQLDQLHAWDLPALNLFRYEGESVGQYQDRRTTQFADLRARWSYQVAAPVQAYTMNLWTVEEVQAIATWTSAFVNARPWITLVMPFELDRVNGLPDLIASYQAATPGDPTLVPIASSAYPQARLYA